MAAASSALGSKIREDLSCSICLELFTRPKVLPCQHTFCQDCLQDHAGKGGTFQCPNCRRQVRLPAQGVAGLPDNRLVTSLCDKVKQQATLSAETTELLQPGNRCGFHPSEKLKLYCKLCHVPICELCLEEAHDDHLTTTIKKAAQERRSTVQALINEGRNIVESYCGFVRALGEEEKTLNEQIQKTKNGIVQAYNEMVQKLAEQKDQLLAEAEQNKSKNLESIKNGRDRVLADVGEMSAACDRAEQDMEQGGLALLSQETVLTGVVGKYRGKAAPTPVQTQPAVFHPTAPPVPVLGHVTVQSHPSTPIPAAHAARDAGHHHGDQNQSSQSLPSAPIPAAPAARGTGHHHGNQNQSSQSLPSAPIPAAPAARGTGHLHGNQMQDMHRCQRITFGRQGSGTGQFNSPSGVTVSAEGEIFVVDAGNKSIQVFNLQGTFVRQFPTVVPGEQKMKPHDVALDGDGNLWVVGNMYNRFAVLYNKQGRGLRKLDLPWANWQRESAVSVDTRRNHILITQTKGEWGNLHGEVLVFNTDGTLVRTVGQQQGMKYPRYITVDEQGRILVSDCAKHCVFVYNEDGRLLFQFGGEGSYKGQLYNPQGICTDSAGNIIVADSGNSCVLLFDQAGRFLRHMGTDMEGARTVAMATQGQLVVTFWNHTVSVLRNY